MDKYIPLFPSGFMKARELGYIEKNGPANGNLCLQCGAIVGSRRIHDNWHWYAEEEEEIDGS